MGGAVVEFVRPIPGNPNSTRVRCRIFYPHGCKGKDAIVPNLRIRLRPCDAQEAVVGSTVSALCLHWSPTLSSGNCGVSTRRRTLPHC